MATREQETWWVLRAQSGDREALDALLGSVEAPLLRYVAGMVGERAAAEDVVQETFIRIYRKLGWLEEPALFRAWAYRIATREALRLRKRDRRWTDQVRDEAVLEALPAPGADEGLATELAERLPQLLDRVSPASRAVLELHYLHDMRLGEVAAVLELPVGTVKSRLAYGLAALRRALVETEEGG